MPASWLQLSVRARDPAAFDVVSNFLIERGSPGVMIKEQEVQAYFAHSHKDASLRRDVRRFVRGINGIYPGLKESSLRWRIVKDRNWNTSWRRFFTPQKIGKGFWVSPPWKRLPRSRGGHVITIEPGMAFGTGTHATTRGCLEFIATVAESWSGTTFTALDVGTGSGILAIALAKLGANKVWAIDNDPAALKVARENLRRNGVEEKIRLSGTEVERLRKSFSVVVANLTAETILDLADALANRVAAKGCLILSGILHARAAHVARCFSSHGFRLLKRGQEKEWATLLLQRK